MMMCMMTSGWSNLGCAVASFHAIALFVYCVVSPCVNMDDCLYADRLLTTRQAHKQDLLKRRRDAKKKAEENMLSKVNSEVDKLQMAKVKVCPALNQRLSKNQQIKHLTSLRNITGFLAGMHSLACTTSAAAPDAGAYFMSTARTTSAACLAT